jgi:F-type H+-transporting ATPase subunit a
LVHSISFLELLSGGGRIPEVLVGTWIVMGSLIVFALIARAALSRASDPIVPDQGITVRSVAEVMVEWIDSFVRSVMDDHQWADDHQYRKLLPFLGSLFVFILAANLFGLLPGIEAPTGNSNLTFALGAICLVYYMGQGFHKKGMLGYLKSFLGPLILLAPLMLPIELADNLFRPFTLGLRLFANMFADHTVLSIFISMTYVLLPLAFYALGSIVCIIQALIFMVLTMSYIKMATSHDH